VTTDVLRGGGDGVGACSWHGDGDRWTYLGWVCVLGTLACSNGLERKNELLWVSDLDQCTRRRQKDLKNINTLPRYEHVRVMKIDTTRQSVLRFFVAWKLTCSVTTMRVITEGNYRAIENKGTRGDLTLGRTMASVRSVECGSNCLCECFELLPFDLIMTMLLRTHLRATRSDGH